MTEQNTKNLPIIQIPNGVNEGEYISSLTLKGAMSKYGDDFTDDARKRIDYELDVIIANGFSRYFLLLYHILDIAKNELDAWIGPGRGSATGSIVAYCLGITKVDPLKYGLLFERFINPEKHNYPDIDIDIDLEGHCRLMQWLYKEYGKENVACVSNGNGVHPCSVVISDSKIRDITPVRSTQDWYGNQVLATVKERKDLVDSELVIFDFLRLNYLSINKRACDIIMNNHGLVVDLDSIPLNDEKTLGIFRNADTEYMPQFCSSSLREELHKLQPESLEELIVLHALDRPGLSVKFPHFIGKRRGKEEILYDLPFMEKYLHESCGIIVFQEQIIQIINEISDFSMGRCDTLRKAFSMRKEDVLFNEYDQFIRAGIDNGFSQEDLEELWINLYFHGNIFFVKAHSVAYTILAFQSAYLLAHYPEEYKEAYMSASLTAL